LSGCKRCEYLQGRIGTPFISNTVVMMTAYEIHLIRQSEQLSGMLTRSTWVTHSGNVGSLLYHDYTENNNPMAVEIINSQGGSVSFKQYFDIGKQIVEKYLSIVSNKN
jgi:hypothetical protein